MSDLQRMPLGAGVSAHAVRRGRGIVRARAQLVFQVGLVGLGVSAAVVGAVLYTAEPEVVVQMDAAHYRIAGQELESRGPGAYQNPSGATLVLERRGDLVVAATSTHVGGAPIRGRCVLAAGSARETCEFTLSGRSLTATDIRSPKGWNRRYSDGKTVAIRVDGRLDTPVPFPVGR